MPLGMEAGVFGNHHWQSYSSSTIRNGYVAFGVIVLRLAISYLLDVVLCTPGDAKLATYIYMNR